MKVCVFVFLSSFILSFSLTSIYFREIKAKSEILGEEAEVKEGVSPILTQSSSPSSTLSPSSTSASSGPEALRAGGQVPTPPASERQVIPTPTLIFSPIPQPSVSSEEIHKFIERFAGQYGVDPNVLRHIAVCESGFNPIAVNGSYAGLYQFTSVTWKNTRIEMGEDTNPDLRFNVEEAIQTATYIISVGKQGIWPNCYP